MKSLLFSKNSPTNLQHSRLATDLHIPINSAQIKKIFIQKPQKYIQNHLFFQKYLVNSKKSSTFALAFKKKQVFLAQLVEQLTLNQWVQGSSPWEDTKDIRRVSFFLYYVCRYQKNVVTLQAN